MYRHNVEVEMLWTRGACTDMILRWKCCFNTSRKWICIETGNSLAIH